MTVSSGLATLVDDGGRQLGPAWDPATSGCLAGTIGRPAGTSLPASDTPREPAAPLTVRAHRSAPFRAPDRNPSNRRPA
jgi:hypothetical protein